MKILSFLFLSLFAVSLFPAAHSTHDPLLPRPLILEYPPSAAAAAAADIDGSDVRLKCRSWRVAGEANNLGPWITVPAECGHYIRDYVTGTAYRYDLEIVAREASLYARSVRLAGDGKDAWVFDIDETLLSNLPYYADHGFGLEVFDGHEFDKWVEKATAPAIQSSQKLYEEIRGLGFKIFLLTGRSEAHRGITVDNLNKAGFQDWERLILRCANDRGKPAITYKSEKRFEIGTDGYRILGNSGDQWSDLLGSDMSNRSFKLPNPMYYIP